MREQINKLEQIIKYIFKDKKLLLTALTHPSYLNEHRLDRDSYQRLEFLGDAILEYLASDYLFKHFQQIREGRLTEIRSALVRTESLALVAKSINLGQFIFLSKGEEANNGRLNQNILADAIESLLASIYLDSNLIHARIFFDRFIKSQLDIIVKEKLYIDSKTQLQEIIQAKYKKTPVYKLAAQRKIDGDTVFEIGVFLEKKCLAIGVGKNKRLAEAAAAKSALGNLNNL